MWAAETTEAPGATGGAWTTGGSPSAGRTTAGGWTRGGGTTAGSPEGTTAVTTCGGMGGGMTGVAAIGGRKAMPTVSSGTR